MISKTRNLIKFVRFYIIAGFITLLVGCGEEPKDLYGPVPLYGVLVECISDDQCINAYGDDWYCNHELEISYCERKDAK